MRTFIGLILLNFAGTLPPSCLASPVLQSPCESAEDCQSSKTIKGPMTALSITHPHSSNDGENRVVASTAHRDIPPALLKRHAPLTSQHPHVHPALAERNLTHKTDPDLNLHWNKIVIISAPFNASNTHQKLHNASSKTSPTPPSSKTPHGPGTTYHSASTLRLFFIFSPDDRMALQAYMQHFAHGMLHLIAIGMIYATSHVAALTAFG